MKTSETLTEFATAMAAAQAEMENPAKDTINGHFKSRYADLAGGLNTIRPVLAKHAITVLQTTCLDGDLMLLTTRLLHKSGQWVESVHPVCKFPARQQEVGSALTYARRYSLFALAGVAGEDDDDDGNEASKDKTPARVAREPAPKPEPKKEQPNMDHVAYASDFRTELRNATKVDEVRHLWNAQRIERERIGLHDTSALAGELHQEWLARGKELAAASKAQQKDAA